MPLPAPLGWALTQAAVVAGWVLFRSPSLSHARHMFQHLAGHGASLVSRDSALIMALPFMVVGMALALLAPNTARLEGRYRPTVPWMLAGGAIMAVAVFFLLGQLVTPEFLYYEF